MIFVNEYKFPAEKSQSVVVFIVDGAAIGAVTGGRSQGARGFKPRCVTCEK